MNRLSGPMVFDRTPALVCDPEDPKGKSRTQQHFKDDVNINKIVKRFMRTGQLDASLVNQRVAAFHDVSEIGDFSDVSRKLIAAQDQFMTLPADVRGRFDNDPAKLLAFLADPSNTAEGIKLGLIQAPAAPPQGQPEPVVVPVVPGPVQAPKTPAGG